MPAVTKIIAKIGDFFLVESPATRPVGVGVSLTSIFVPRISDGSLVSSNSSSGVELGEDLGVGDLVGVGLTVGAFVGAEVGAFVGGLVGTAVGAGVA